MKSDRRPAKKKKATKKIFSVVDAVIKADSYVPATPGNTQPGSEDQQVAINSFALTHVSSLFAHPREGRNVIKDERVKGGKKKTSRKNTRPITL